MKCSKITCKRCKGKGVQPLPKRLVPVIELLEKFGALSVGQVHSLLGSTLDITATNHKINQLVRLKLIKIAGKERPKKYVIC